MRPLLELITTVLQLYIWAVIISVLMSWLVNFNIINRSNHFVYLVGDFLYRITEPALGRLRRLLPDLGGIDLSPLALILILVFAQRMLILYWPLPF